MVCLRFCGVDSDERGLHTSLPTKMNELILISENLKEGNLHLN